MFTVRTVQPNATSSRDATFETKREALSFAQRGGEIARIQRFPRLYTVQYKPKRNS